MTFLLALPGLYLSIRILAVSEMDDSRVPFWVTLRFMGMNIVNLRTSITGFAMYLARPVVLFGPGRGCSCAEIGRGRGRE